MSIHEIFYFVDFRLRYRKIRCQKSQKSSRIHDKASILNPF